MVHLGCQMMFLTDLFKNNSFDHYEYYA
jgi:hypothetical protein